MDVPFWGIRFFGMEQPDSLEAAPQSLGQAPPSPDYVPGLEHPPFVILSIRLFSYLVLLIYDVTLLDPYSAVTLFGGVTDWYQSQGYRELVMSPYTVTYTSISSEDVPFWGIRFFDMEQPDSPEAAPQSPGQAPPSPDYVPGLEHPPLPDYVPGLEELERAPLIYVPKPEYPEYLVPSEDEAPMEDQPLPDDTSPAALSLGYIADSDPEKDLEEDHANRRDDDDDGDDEEEEDEEDEENEEEEEHLALADSNDVPLAADPVEVDRLLAIPTPPPSLLSPWSSPLPQIPSLPLPLPSPPTSPTYVEAPLSYRAAKIRWRAASPSTHQPSEISSPLLLLPSTTHRDDIPEADMPLRKRACFTAPTSRYKVGESSSAVAASIRASESRAMTSIGEVSIWRRERRYILSMASSYEHEAVIARQAWSHSESKIQAMEAQIRALQRDVDVLQRLRIKDEDRVTAHIQHDHDRFGDLVRAAEIGP
ncbi:hypothetical protein Tco_0988507 [Tanacetum coccineum]|uniref:Uncharacterized protein n=1 Tax=Tanacetum coccineum TaxID=301880 RepID=A0ABQ5ERL9_9ASTR